MTMHLESQVTDLIHTWCSITVAIIGATVIRYQVHQSHMYVAYSLPPLSTSILFFFNIYLFNLFIWLRRVLVVEHGILAEACGIFRCGARASLLLWYVGFSLSSCGVRAPGPVGSVVRGTQALSLRRVSSLVVVHELSCPAACGILVP